MASVYSSQFIATHAGTTLSWTVPAGHVAVVRSLAAFNANAIVSQAVQVHLTYTPATITQIDLGPQASQQVDMRVVVLPGDTIVVVPGADCDAVLSGYLLTTP